MPWDVITAEKFAKELNKILNNLNGINHTNIDHYVPTTSNPVDILEFHGFCDIPNGANFTAIYIRAMSNFIVIMLYLHWNVDSFQKRPHDINLV